MSKPIEKKEELRERVRMIGFKYAGLRSTNQSNLARGKVGYEEYVAECEAADLEHDDEVLALIQSELSKQREELLQRLEKTVLREADPYLTQHQLVKFINAEKKEGV
jgi:hypothetical protein